MHFESRKVALKNIKPVWWYDYDYKEANTFSYKQSSLELISYIDLCGKIDVV